MTETENAPNIIVKITLLFQTTNVLFFKGGSLKLLNKMFGGIFIFVTLQKKYLKSRGKSLEEMSFERTTFATFASIRVHM